MSKLKICGVLIVTALVMGAAYAAPGRGGGGGGGGGVKDPGTPKGTYTITVNAASGGTIHHSTSLKLTVN